MKIKQQYFIVLFVINDKSIVNAEKFRDRLTSLGSYHLIGHGALILKPKEMTTSKKLNDMFDDVLDMSFITKINQSDFDGKLSEEIWKFIQVKE